MISRILTGLSEHEWQSAWAKVLPHLHVPIADKPMALNREIPTFAEWKQAVVFEGKNRQFIHRCYGEKISLRAGVQEVIDEIADPTPAQAFAKVSA
jgi:hypothetical protein